MIVGKSTLPLSDRHLFTKRLGVGGIKAIFGVHALGVRAEDVDGVGGVPLAVEDQVGDVEVDTDVVEANVAYGADEGDRGLLAGLAVELLTVVAAVGGALPDRRDGFGIHRVVGIFWDEAAMSGERGDADLLREIRDVLSALDAGGAGGARDEPDGLRSMVEVIHLGPRSTGNGGAGLDVVTVESLAEFGGCGVVGVARADLARGEAEVVDAADCGVGVGRDADHDPEVEFRSGLGEEAARGERRGGLQNEPTVDGHLARLYQRRGGKCSQMLTFAHALTFLAFR